MSNVVKRGSCGAERCRTSVARLHLISYLAPASSQLAAVQPLRQAGRRSTHRVSTGPAQRQHSVSTGSAQVYHRASLGPAQGQHRVSTGSAQGPHRVGTGSAQGRHRVRTGSAQGQHRVSIKAARTLRQAGAAQTSPPLVLVHVAAVAPVACNPIVCLFTTTLSV